MRRTVVLLSLLLVAGCSKHQPSSLPPRTPWRTFPAPSVDSPLLQAEQWLRDEANGWRTAYDPVAGTPARGARGGFGLGNGIVFGFVGIGEPDLATIHEAIGPGYECPDGYFSDLTTQVNVNGQPWSPTGEWQWRVRGTAITVTLLRGDNLDLLLVDHAPWTRSSWWGAAAPEERALVRFVVAHATGGATLQNVVVSQAGQTGWAAHGEVVTNVHPNTPQQARLVALGEGAGFEQNAATLTWPSIAPDAEGRGTFAVVMSTSAADEQATLTALTAADPLELLHQTRDSWRAWSQAGTQVTSPEPMLDDLIDATRILLKVQQAANGSVSPMSEYTHVWLRDTIGPVLGLLSLGHPEDVQHTLDYLWVGIVAKGDLENSVAGNLTVPSPLPAGPDFSTLPPLQGKVAAEGPSYVVLQHDELARWTGDRTAIGQRFGLLRRAVEQQQIGTDGLLPFSGDETYRTAMAAALAYPVTEQFTETGFRSLDSSVLLAMAAAALADHARALGLTADAEALTTLAAQARKSADAAYRQPDGSYRPFLAPDGSVAARLYEDESEKPAWLGYLDSEPDQGRASLRAVWNGIDHSLGFPVSVAQGADLGQAYPAAETGIFTGMAPGYFLGAAARTDLPEGATAFDGIARVASTTGTWEEDQARGDASSVALIYNGAGTLGEYTARFRPWEGGINLRAIFDWLVGITPTLTGKGITITVVPRLPTGWPSLHVSNVRLGDATVDVDVAESVTDGHFTRRITIARTGGVVELHVAPGLRLEGSHLDRVALNGQVQSLEALGAQVSAAEHRIRVDLPGQVLAAGGSVVVEAGYQ